MYDTGASAAGAVGVGGLLASTGFEAFGYVAAAVALIGGGLILFRSRMILARRSSTDSE